MEDINMPYSLDVKELEKSYKNSNILRNVNLEINKNGIIGLIGDNGSGKTTLMKSVLKLINIDKGYIKLNNINFNNQYIYEEVGNLIESPKFYQDLSGYQNLIAYSIYNNISKNRVYEIIKEFNIEKFIYKKVKNYSLGMKQQLAIAQALLNKPKLLILDEPMNGLDPNNSYYIKKYLKKISKNTIIILSSHILSDIEDICDSVYMIKNGIIEEVEYNKKDSRYIFICSDSNKVIKLFYKEYDILKIDNKNVAINLKNEEIPLLISRMVENNIKLYSVYKEKISLEYIYYKKSQRSSEV